MAVQVQCDVMVEEVQTGAAAASRGEEAHQCTTRPLVGLPVFYVHVHSSQPLCVLRPAGPDDTFGATAV